MALGRRGIVFKNKLLALLKARKSGGLLTSRGAAHICDRVDWDGCGRRQASGKAA
jgi:hypothetical protein